MKLISEIKIKNNKNDNSIPACIATYSNDKCVFGLNVVSDNYVNHIVPFKTFDIDNSKSNYSLNQYRTKEPYGHVQFIKTTPDNKIIFVLSNSTIEIWDPDSEKYERRIQAHNHFITGLDIFIQDNLYQIVSCACDNMIKIWNPLTGKCLNILKTPLICKGISCLITQSNFKRIVCGSFNSKIFVWNLINKENVSSWECQIVMKKHKNVVRCLGSFSNGKIASGSDDDTIKIWDPVTGICEFSFDCSFNNKFMKSMLITTDDKIVCLINGRLILWNLDGKTKIILNKQINVIENKKRKHEDLLYNDVLCVCKSMDGKIIGMDLDDYKKGRFNSYKVYVWH